MYWLEECRLVISHRPNSQLELVYRMSTRPLLRPFYFLRSPLTLKSSFPKATTPSIVTLCSCLNEKTSHDSLFAERMEHQHNVCSVGHFPDCTMPRNKTNCNLLCWSVLSLSLRICYLPILSIYVTYLCYLPIYVTYLCYLPMLPTYVTYLSMLPTYLGYLPI